MAKTAKKSKKVKSLPAKNLSAKQAKGVKGGLLPAVNVGDQLTQKVVPGAAAASVRSGKWY